MIGSPEGIVRGESGLGELVEDVSLLKVFSKFRGFSCYVYSLWHMELGLGSACGWYGLGLPGRLRVLGLLLRWMPGCCCCILSSRFMTLSVGCEFVVLMRWWDEAGSSSFVWRFSLFFPLFIIFFSLISPYLLLPLLPPALPPTPTKLTPSQFLNRPLRLLVYNHEYNVLRPLTLTPSRSWGGEGALGCVLGYGALHRIPAPLEEGPPPAPGEALFASSARPSMDEKGAAASVSFDEKRGAGAGAGAYGAPPPAIPTAAELFVPANMPLTSPGSGSATSPPPASTSPAPGAGAAKRAKPRAHHHHHHHHAHAPPAAAVGGLDDYFREGEAKSLEEDYVPKKKEGGVPPPPRAGGPPKGGPPRSGTGTPAAGGEGEKEGAEA